MTRDPSKARPRGWKGMLAAFVAAGAVAWQIMACIESPMSFSPTGDLAFVVMDPYREGEEFAEADGGFFRLMILTRDKELREIERTSTHMLTAPAFSPDGAKFAYLRLPLLAPEDTRRINAFIEGRDDALDNALEAAGGEKWIPIAPESPSPGAVEPGPDDLRDLSLPRLTALADSLSAMTFGGGLISVELVVRQTLTGDLVRTLPMRVPHLSREKYSIAGAYLMAYLPTRPQFGPDGVWLYFWLDGFGMAVNPSSGEKRLLHLGDAFDGDEIVRHRGFLLSPDGKTIAIADTGTLGFLDTGGQRANYVRLQRQPALGAMAWLGIGSLVVLAAEDAALDFYDTDGNLLRSQDLPAEPAESNGDSGMLAVSPDGAYMVVASGGAVQFLARDGQLLGSWAAEDNKEILARPTFTPDSRQIAFKRLVSVEAEEDTDDDERITTSDIVFFTPEGQELFRVPIPPIPEDERAAAPAPATEEAPK